MAQRVRARAWCFTINNYEDVHISKLRELDCKYIVYGAENCPETGTPHLQGYVYFQNPRDFNAVRRLLGGHVEAARGRPKEARDYCIKDGEFEERGELPQTPEEQGERERARWASARASATSGKFDEIDDELYIKYQNSFKRMAREDQRRPSDLCPRQTYGIWIHGPPRTGKSHYARTEFGQSLYLKGLNKWWDGYEGEDNVLIDEVAPEHSGFMAPFLKTWVDRWKFSAEFKGGRSVIRPQRIIVTSNYSIDECFSGVDLEALKSRFEVVEMTTVYNIS